MANSTKIEWTDATWNPTRGCTRVSPGCGGPNHEGGCYAEKIAARFSGPGQPFEGFAKRTKFGGAWTGKMALVDDMLTVPLRWRKPRRIFVNSMSDLFHENLPDEAIDRVFAVMALAPWHTYQVLTKRGSRMRRYLTAAGVQNRIVEAACKLLGRITSPAVINKALRRSHLERGRSNGGFVQFVQGRWPLPNVWLGVSVEDQPRADERIPDLLATPAAVRFLSCEPMLGPLDLYNGDPDPRLGGHKATQTFLGDWWERGDDLKGPSRHGVDWVIAGGESGPGARPSHPDWFRSLRDQCRAAEVPFFFKQWGEWAIAARSFAVGRLDPKYAVVHEGDRTTWMERVGKKRAGAMLDGREWREFPS